MKRQAHRRNEGERGFALLLVFAMAAAVAMLLYIEMPRAIFESQRSKEQLLVERGEQYQRAIGLYFKKNKKWPQEIKDLEETNGIRYLRHRFKDPMTGKDEWRIIHTNGMMLTDSLVQKQQDPLKGGKDANGNPLPPGQGGQQQQSAGGFGNSSFGNSGFGSSGGGFGSNSNPGSNSGFGQPQAVQPTQQPQQAAVYDPATGQFNVPQPGQDGPLQAWQQRRPNDRPVVPVGQAQQPQQHGDNLQNADNTEDLETQPVFAGQQDPTQPVPEGQNGIPGQGIPGQGVPGQPVPGQAYPVAGMNPAGLNAPAGANPGAYPGAPGTPGQPGSGYPSPVGVPNSNMANSPMGGGMRSGFPGGGGGFGAPGGSQDPSQNAAMDVIRRSLTQPRPGGMAGLQQQQGGMQGMGGAGPGIAGVATKFEGASIRVYNERKKYQEWEFVYDMSKDPALNPQMGQQQQQQGSVSNPGFGSFGSNSSNQGSGFGSNSGSGFGSNSGSSFGSNSGSGFGSGGSGSSFGPQPQSPGRQP